MARKQITLIHAVKHYKIIVPFGFSWTTLFFGFFVPITRRDLAPAIFMFLFGIIPFIQIISAFLYNSYYIKKLLLEDDFLIKDFGGINPSEISKKLKIDALDFLYTN